jgi:hypothetical protein
MQHVHAFRSSALAAALCLSGSVGAQSAPLEVDDPIVTDRPGFLFSPILVPEGRLQIEAGLPTYARTESGGATTRAWSLPVALRYGLSRDVELRASLPTWTDAVSDSGANDEGLSDVEVGVKLALSRDDDAPLALQASLRLPTGAEGFTTDEIGGSLLLLHTREFENGLGLTGMLGATYAPVDDGPDALTGSIGALLWGPLTDEWSGYVEAIALPGLNDAAGQAYAGGALIWAARSDLQLDLSVDFGLDRDSADVIAAAGVSFRW